MKKAGPTYAKYLPPKEGVKWNVELAPGEGDNAAHCTGHVDAKRNMLGKRGSGWMVLRVPKVLASHLIQHNSRFIPSA